MHIKVLIAAMLTMVACAGSASAADLGKTSDEGGYKDLPETAMWTGVTLGVGVGGAFSSLSASDAEVAALGINKSSVFGEAEAVLSWQFPRSPLVIGAYGDLTYSDIYKSVGGAVGGQLGYAVGNVQPYVSVGGAFAQGNSGVEFGAGLKFRATPKINFEVEWKRTDWGSFGYSGVDVKTTSDTALLKVSYKLN